MSYRDERAALTARCEQLERNIAELRTRDRNFEALADDFARVQRELAETRARLLAVLPSADVSPLDRARVASPCNAAWSDMEGDDHVRFCPQCKKNVYDLSSLTRADAEALVRKHDGRMCARFYRRADGTMLARDCPAGQRKRRRRVALVVLGVGAVAAAGGLIAYEIRSDPYVATSEEEGAERYQGGLSWSPEQPTENPHRGTVSLMMGDLGLQGDGQPRPEDRLQRAPTSHHQHGARHRSR